MRLHDNRQMANILTDLVADIWDKRRTLLSDRKKSLYFPFRISLTDHEADVTRETYVHVIITREHWWATVNDKAHFNYDNHNDLVGFAGYQDGEESRCESWRHYAFRDVLQDYVQTKLDIAAGQLTEAGQPFLWDMFPIEELRLAALPEDNDTRYNSNGLIPTLEALPEDT